MGQPLSFEDRNTYFFITIRTIESRLWFINNQALTDKIVGFLARNHNVFGVELYAFVLMGNHYHLIARFPRANKARFLKALDSIIALLTRSHAPGCPGGGLWATSAVPLPLLTHEDVLDKFLYCALNPVSSGVVQRISEYPNYNSFTDAIAGRTTHHTVFLRTDYNKRKVQNPKTKMKDFIKHHTLTYSRLPGYERMTQHGKRLILDVLSPPLF